MSALHRGGARALGSGRRLAERERERQCVTISPTGVFHLRPEHLQPTSLIHDRCENGFIANSRWAKHRHLNPIRLAGLQRLKYQQRLRFALPGHQDCRSPFPCQVVEREVLLAYTCACDCSSLRGRGPLHATTGCAVAVVLGSSACVACQLFYRCLFTCGVSRVVRELHGSSALMGARTCPASARISR